MTGWLVVLSCRFRSSFLRRAVIVVAFVAGFAAAAVAQTTPRVQQIEITAGTQRFLATNEAIGRIALGSGEIADANVLTDRQIRVLGLKPGRTDLLVFSDNGKTQTTYLINVVPNLAGLRGLLGADPDLRGLRLSIDGERVVMSGTVISLEAHSRAQSLGRAYFGEGFIDTVRVSGDQMVAVEVKFAAVSVTTLKALGFNFGSFSKGFQIATTPPSTVNSFSFGRDGLSLETSLPLNQAFNIFAGLPKHNILAILSALSSTDLAQVLAEPTLLVRSGEQADFIAGGEIPIPVPQTGGGGNGSAITIDYKPFGVRLAIAPTVMSPTRIVMKVSPEVSELDFSSALSIQGFNVPALRKRATSTTVELADGQSFILAGLMYSTAGNIEEKVPALGDIPILGSFFKRSRNQREQQELIIIATPRLVRPIDGGKLPPLPGEEFRKSYNPSVGDMLLNAKPLEDAVIQHGLIK